MGSHVECSAGDDDDNDDNSIYLPAGRTTQVPIIKQEHRHKYNTKTVMMMILISGVSRERLLRSPGVAVSKGQRSGWQNKCRN